MKAFKGTMTLEVLVFLTLVLGFSGCKSTPTTPENPVTGPVIDYFLVSPTLIKLGDSATLSWSVKNATSVSIDNSGKVSASGSITVTPTIDTTYTLNASNGTKTASRSCSIQVIIPAKVVMTYGPTYKAFGNQFSAYGKIKNVGSVTASNIVIILHFYYKSGWGGGFYKDYIVNIGTLNKNEEVD